MSNIRVKSILSRLHLSRDSATTNKNQEYYQQNKYLTISHYNFQADSHNGPNILTRDCFTLDTDQIQKEQQNTACSTVQLEIKEKKQAQICKDGKNSKVKVSNNSTINSIFYRKQSIQDNLQELGISKKFISRRSCRNRRKQSNHSAEKQLKIVSGTTRPATTRPSYHYRCFSQQRNRAPRKDFERLKIIDCEPKIRRRSSCLPSCKPPIPKFGNFFTKKTDYKDFDICPWSTGLAHPHSQW